MIKSTIEKIRHCCENQKTLFILFDGADTGDLPILSCEDCSLKPLFQKFVKSKIAINSDSDIDEILNSF